MTFGVLALCASVAPALAGDHDPGRAPSAERGRVNVHRPLNPPFWSIRAYEDAWTQWGVAAKPADYARAFRDRYGLHPAAYDNGGLPMGFTRAKGLLGLGQGIGNDCLLCHAGTVAGQTIIGLGNTALDMQSLYEEMAAADTLDPVMPLPLCNVRGTSEASNFAVYLMQFRDKDLRHRVPVKFPLCTTLCEDVPAWWLYKKKKTIYHLGLADSRSVRTMMPFLLIPGNSAEYIKRKEPDFADIRAFLLSMQPPRYPFPIDEARAARGKAGLRDHLRGATVPTDLAVAIPTSVSLLDEIGTDPTLATAFAPEGAAHYLQSWFAAEHGPGGEKYHGLGGGGYQAPPLDGIWASAPYLHNGSAPTVYHVLKSTARPKIFTRSFRGEKDDYDPVRLGMKVTVLHEPADPSSPAIALRKVYDTTQPGRGNGGHLFGDKLSEEERMAVIEYLKTL